MIRTSWLRKPQDGTALSTSTRRTVTMLSAEGLVLIGVARQTGDSR